MVTGSGTVSTKIKGHYGKGRPSTFSTHYRPVVFWNITYKCNLRCEHCYIDALPEGKPGELNASEQLRIADEIVEAGIPLVVFTGGEPLAAKSFWLVAERLSGKRLPKLSLSTNGTLIDRDVASRLRDLGFTYVGVSLDSVDPSEHDTFRGVKGAFEAAVRGIRNSVEAGISTGIRMTLTKYNISKALEVVKLARKLGAERVSLYLLDTIGRARDIAEALPTHEQLRRLADELIVLARRLGGNPEVLVVRGNFLGIYVADKLSRTREDFLEYIRMLGAQGDCGRKTLSIYPDGSVKPCQFIEYYELGNLKRQKLKDVLSPTNEKLRPFLEVDKNLRGPKCSTCIFKRVCGGGSRNRALVLNSDMWGDDPLCPINPKKIADKWGLTEQDIDDALGESASSGA
ncbi:MAG: radical SAM protein [Thermoproteota archaeon]